MDKEEDQPEKRFESFEQIFDEVGIAIGFTLPGNTFIFKYDADGGWKDEKGNYFTADGVMKKGADEVEDYDEVEDEDDDEILDEFEKMLDDDRPKQKKVIKPKPQATGNSEGVLQKLIAEYRSKQNIRDGLPVELFIYFKMRLKFYSRVKPSVQNQQSVSSQNEQIKRIKEEVQKQTEKLKQNNKWLLQNANLQYSGAQLDENTYDRYWYGVVQATADNFLQIHKQITNSVEFAMLQEKTFYALQSKFYLKKKMKETIQSLASKLSGDDDDLYKISANNLPENFPCSFILDLMKFAGVGLEQLYSIELIDDYTADILLTKKGAAKFLNIEGYEHDEKQFIYLDLEVDEKKRKIARTNFFKIGLESGIPYKNPVRQIHDVLALEKSKLEFVKLFSEEEEKTNGGFRFIITGEVLKRVLMFRGNSICVSKVELFNK